jgi:molybdopterin molybdotransferase
VITTAEASKAILDAIQPSGSETLSLQLATGRVLRQEVVAERDQPPFDRVMMDGIAMSFEAYSLIEPTRWSASPRRTRTSRRGTSAGAW